MRILRLNVLSIANLFVGAILAVALNARKTDRGKPYPYKTISKSYN